MFLVKESIVGRPGGRVLALVLCGLLAFQPAPASGTVRQPPERVIAAVRQDAGRRSQTPPERWKVRSANPRTWPDGCLGLANPEEVCAQSLVEGWEIVLSDDGKTRTYRTDSTGRNVRPYPAGARSRDGRKSSSRRDTDGDRGKIPRR